jgi:outer membrane lipopolysaccharide assembly protein LptE/RlpB
MRSALGWLGLLAATTLLGACGEKVDCDKLGTRLHDCTRELMFTLNPEAKKRLEKATDPELKKQNAKLVAKDIARNRATLKKQVTDQCKAKKGRAADAKAINECLDVGAKDCKKFAQCFAKYLKTKGE